MNEKPVISRREWFRLRTPDRNHLLGNGQSTNKYDGLQPIEHPPNHDGMDMSELPPMREAVLSTEQVNALVTDIGSLANQIQLMLRAGKTARATASRIDTIKQLELAKIALLGGTVPRIQIRYRWRDSLWIDTLTNESGCYKLVRISHSTI